MIKNIFVCNADREESCENIEFYAFACGCVGSTFRSRVCEETSCRTIYHGHK